MAPLPFLSFINSEFHFCKGTADKINPLHENQFLSISFTGIRANPAETQRKRPLWHIAQFLMRNVGSCMANA